LGTTVGQDIAAALSGQQTVDAALKSAQDDATQTMQQAGYIK
jgi:sorbitol/mannitol transport system substrate-binding protein